MEKLQKVTDRAMSWREYLFWYMYLTAGPAQDVMELEDVEFQALKDEFMLFLKGKRSKDVSF